MQAITDTSPEIAAMIHARLMALSGSERFLMGIRTCEAAWRMVLASFPGDMFGPHFCSMKITEDVRTYAAEQGVAEDAALAAGMAEKSREFVEKGAEVYAKA